MINGTSACAALLFALPVVVSAHGNGQSTDDDLSSAIPLTGDPAPASASEESPKEREAVQAAGNASKSLIQTLSDQKLIDANLANEALEVINNLLRTTRADQSSIYLFVRTVNRNIDRLVEDSKCDCAAYVTEIRSINRKLMRASYTDGLFQNANLSNQIKTRLPLLIADSLKLHTPRGANLRDDFKEELELLSERFLSSKRFRAGIGLSYSYLPRLPYQATPRVDFSPFQTAASGGSDHVIINTEFRNRSVPALLLSAKVPFLQVDVAIPRTKHKETTTTTVQQRNGDANNDLLVRTTIASELAIEYDANVKFSIVDILNWWQEINNRPRANLQLDYGIGIGLTGFEIQDNASTDVRFRADPSDTFNDLPTGATITSASSTSFTTPFVSVHYTFRVSDEFQVGVEGRYYQKDRSSDREVDVDGATFALSAVWYPTFNW